eukprot:PhF_6_TR9232/c0_g1_i1/m.14546
MGRKGRKRNKGYTFQPDEHQTTEQGIPSSTDNHDATEVTINPRVPFAVPHSLAASVGPKTMDLVMAFNTLLAECGDGLSQLPVPTLCCMAAYLGGGYTYAIEGDTMYVKHDASAAWVRLKDSSNGWLDAVDANCVEYRLWSCGEANETGGITDPKPSPSTCWCSVQDTVPFGSWSVDSVKHEIVNRHNSSQQLKMEDSGF